MNANYVDSAQRINAEIAQALTQLQDDFLDPVIRIRLTCKVEALSHQLIAAAGRMINAD